MAQSPLYSYVAAYHQRTHQGSWGQVLDAGTGWNSLAWITTLPTAGWTAVTVDPSRTTRLLPAYQPTMRHTDAIILGDWQDPTLLKDQQFDVVILDYLIGAIDAFTPYFQDQIVQRLAVHCTDRLYIIGLEPMLTTPQETGAGLALALDQLKDACRLHAGKRPYREYPATWVERRCKEAGLSVLHTKHFPRQLRAKYVHSRVAACRHLLHEITDTHLQDALELRIKALEQQLLPLANTPTGIQASSNYVIVAQR